MLKEGSGWASATATSNMSSPHLGLSGFLAPEGEHLRKESIHGSQAKCISLVQLCNKLPQAGGQTTENRSLLLLVQNCGRQSRLGHVQLLSALSFGFADG